MENVGYPQELRELGAAALLLASLRHTIFHIKTATSLEALKRKIVAGRNKQNPPLSIKRLKASQSQQFAPVVKRKHREEDTTIDETAKVLPGNQPVLSQEEVLKLINDYRPPDIPPVSALQRLIGRCSKPFEKQLTESDVRDDQSRLSMNKADVEKYILPLLNENENPIEGVKVTTYDTNGKEFQMTFKIWVSKIHVLTGGWKAFYSEHQLKKDQDFVTVWMFRNLNTGRLCFVITWRRLPVLEPVNRKRKVKKN